MTKIDNSPVASSPTWSSLEAFVREQVQACLQRVLEEEVDELLGRAKHARRGAESSAYRNGYGKARQLALLNGTVTVRRPRVRNLDDRFVSRILPLFQRRTPEVAHLLPELYLHGLATGDFTLALRGLLGDGAPLSASIFSIVLLGFGAAIPSRQTTRRGDLQRNSTTKARVRLWLCASSRGTREAAF